MKCLKNIQIKINRKIKQWRKDKNLYSRKLQTKYKIMGKIMKFKNNDLYRNYN